jgi:CDP-diacylglycerol--glycerol-3-phosphate 3-phosphatidyltransferase
MMRPPYDQMLTWPNVLTLLRISLVPLLVILFYLPFQWAHTSSAFVFAIASVTDWLDGYLARYLKQTTKLGAFLDPVADKLMVSVALVLLVAEPTFRSIDANSSDISIPTLFITIPAGIIVARELIVSALREWMSEIGKRTSVAVSTVGKFKTAVQMLALIILLYCDHRAPILLILTGYILLYVAAILTVWSMCVYLKAAWKQLIST